MANNIGTLTPTLIAQSGLALLVAKYPVITKIATDFSSQQIPYGASIITKIPTVGTMQTYSASAGYVTSALNSTDVTVTLNQHVYNGFSINDEEQTQISPILFNQYAESIADSIGLGVMSGIAALWTTGNYTYPVTAQALTGVNRNTIINAETQLNTRNVPKTNRFGVLNSYAYGQLLQDSSLVSTLFVPGGPGVAGPNVPVINGIPFTEYSLLPSGQYQQGIIGSPDSMAFVSRLPQDPGALGLPLMGNITIITDPVSNLSIQLRDWYDFSLGKRNVVYTFMYGVAVGNPKSLQIVTTQ